MIDFTKKQKRVLFETLLDIFDKGRKDYTTDKCANIVEDLLNIKIFENEGSTFSIFFSERIPMEPRAILVFDALDERWIYDIKKDPDEMNYVKQVRKHLNLYYKENN